jgi:DNA-binding NtrC family response regulator
MKLHPIIHEYVFSVDELGSILEKHANKDQLLEKLLIDLNQSHSREIFDDKLILDIDKTIREGHPDSNLFFFFISYLISYTIGVHHIEIARSLHSILTSSKNEKLHPIIQMACMQAEAAFVFAAEKKSEWIDMTKQSLTANAKKYPRYKVLLLNYCGSLAFSGMFKKLDDTNTKILNLLATNTRFSLRILQLKLINCYMIGNWQEGFLHLAELKKSTTTQLDKNTNWIISSLKIISGDLNESSYEDESYKLLVQILNALLSGKIEEAEKNFQFLTDKFPILNRKPSLLEYVSFHLEIYKGNIEKVKLLLYERDVQGQAHYLDDLFYGRLHLCEKNFDAADQAFIRLIENITRYGAMGRLVYELQFAKEMKLTDILLLMQGWKKDLKIIPSTRKNPSENFQNLIPNSTQLLVGNSLAIKQVKELVKKYATLKAPILVTGETGVGKELVSRSIHDEGSYPVAPFLAINCSALTDSLLQSELFGYVAGAFTGAQKERQGIFEAVGKGTVFLDEFGDISPQMQIALLRVLESNEIRMIGGTKTRKIECRIVVATNVNLHQLVLAKKFREDLYFRLTRFEIRIPTLRERIEDLPDLIYHFLKANNSSSKTPKNINNELLKVLSTYHWPGNIRELKNEIDRLSILHADKELLTIADFDFTHLQEWSPQTYSQPEKISSKNDLNKQTNKPSETVTSEGQYLKIIQQRGPQSERRHALLKEVFREYKKLTRNQVMGITNASPSTATKDLKILCESGFILRRSPTKSPRTDYFELATS